MGGTRLKAQKQNKVNNQKQCYAHRHMTAVEYAIWSVCRAMAAKHDGVVFFSGPRIAKRFRSMSKNTPYTALKGLVSMKWFEPLDDPKHSRKDKASGKHSATRYKVLTHDEWVAKHPDSCPDDSQSWQEALSTPSQFEGTVTLPSKNQGTVHPKIRERSIQKSGNGPSQFEGTNLYIPTKALTTLSTNTPPPSQFEGTATVPLSLDGADKALAPIRGGEPFPQIGMDDARVLRERGLVERGGVWFTEMGTKVSPNALEILLRQGRAAA